MTEPQNKPWWTEPGRLKRFCCDVCSSLHCYWCGLPVRTDVTQRHPASPTREHVDARYENGALQKSGTIALAHALCNTLRGHQPWVPFHGDGYRTDRQLESLWRLLSKAPELVDARREQVVQDLQR